MSASKNKVIKNPMVKAIFWSVIGIFIFFALFTTAIQIPYFQTKIVKELSESVSERINYPVTIEHVNLDWFDELHLQGLRILDRKQNLMIGVEDLVVDFDLASLISEDQIKINQATLNYADIRLTKYAVDEEINIGTFIKSIKSMGQSGR